MIIPITKEIIGAMLQLKTRMHFSNEEVGNLTGITKKHVGKILSAVLLACFAAR